MNEVDDLQSFIADCEWKTRKILRDSNKRMKDNARTLATKDRVEKLNHGTNVKPTFARRVVSTPLTKTQGLDRPIRKSNTPTPKKSPLKDWKEPEKIIHDACETIKSFPADKRSLKAAATCKEKVQTGIHSSLSASPFCGLKNKSDSLTKSKQNSRCVRTNLDSDDDDSTSKDEPAMVTRRTIERDFYIMSKKRNNPTSKRRHGSTKKSESTPELKTSVLRQRYRCEERIMKTKRRRAERLFKKLQRLKIPNDESDDPENGISADEAEYSDSSVSSDEEEEHIHPIYDLVERHISNENARSLKRFNKLLMSTNFKPNVKKFWAHLQQNGHGPAIQDGNVLSRDDQILTVSLHAASISGERSDLGEYGSSIEEPRIHYISPYKKRNDLRLQLVVNQPLVGQMNKRTRPLFLVSISVLQNKSSNTWLYEIYDPFNGKTRNFTLLDSELDSVIKTLGLPTSNQPQNIQIEKLVHNQTAQYGNVECKFDVVVSTNELGISCKVYRSKIQTMDGPDGICVEENLISSLWACEVLHILRKHHIYSVFDTEFWLNDCNGKSIWKPLLNLLVLNDESSSMGCITKAYNLLLALKNNLNISTSSDIGKIYDIFHQSSSDVHVVLAEDEHDAPLSMRISGCSPYSDGICPGQSPIGKQGVWGSSEQFIGTDTKSMVPIWPSLNDTRHPRRLDKSQASAFFQYKSLGPQKGDCITVLNSLAFESPVLAPYCFAIDKGYTAPPYSENEVASGIIPSVHLPCTSLLENPVQSRLDTLFPPPIVVLDPGASEVDWKGAPRNADGNVCHCREFNEFDRDGFRVKTSASRVEYDSTIPSIVYGISESAASPNQPTISSFLTNTSHETCTQSLTRKRSAADYHYIAKSDGEGTLSEPYLFATHMSAYSSVFVSRKSISSYREEKSFLHATKEAERKKMDLALKMKAAEELVEKRLKEHILKIENSVKEEEYLVDKSEDSVAVELPSSVDFFSLPIHGEMIPCDVELPIPSSKLADEGDELEQLANFLLKDTNFLKAVAQKLNMSEEQIKQIDSTSNEGNPRQTRNVIDIKADIDEGVAESVLHQAFNTAPEPQYMPKLKLNCKRYNDINHTRSRGDGWKRLARSETVIGKFSLTKRSTKKGLGGPKFKKLEQNRNFIAVNAMQELQYQADPQQFQTQPKSTFVPDLTTERLRLATSYRQQKKAKGSMLSISQQKTLDEILQIPISKTSETAIEEDEVNNLDVDNAVECNEVSLEKVAGPCDHAARAILAVKNHNLLKLEQFLDTEGLSVETRDQHGNSLLILACQQGSKKQAKFLLRRGADMNAQNNGGNTALHYLYEYKHISLAEYLIRKGANDGIKNANGLTVYEGTQL